MFFIDDEWDDAEFAELLAWAKVDPRHHLAISNPKFELFSYLLGTRILPLRDTVGTRDCKDLILL